MHLTFADSRIRSICEKEDKGRAALGQAFDVLRIRLVELMAARSIGELPSEYTRKTVEGEIYLPLGGSAHLVVRANRTPEASRSGNINELASLQILRVEKA